MSELLAKTANISLLALAALPIIALSVARAEPVSIQTSDLDLSRPAQVAELNARIGRAADKICGDQGYVDLVQHDTCLASVRDEALDQLKSGRRLQQAPVADPED